MPKKSSLLRRLSERIKRVFFRKPEKPRSKPSRDLSTRQLFEHIYARQKWGTAAHHARFFSGPGSHEPDVVEPYVEAVRAFLRDMAPAPDVVDLGCGDFNIGRQVRDACGTYIACDIVPALITHNRERFAALDVDFRVVDLTDDELPAGEVVFIRQVLQHLSNDQIMQALPRIRRGFRCVVLTEHLPATAQFTPNLDKPTGPDIRLLQHSGVVLTAPPFNLQVRSERVLCEATQFGGVIRSTAYELA
jgi:SAM-dependent methyltransferase